MLPSVREAVRALIEASLLRVGSPKELISSNFFCNKAIVKISVCNFIFLKFLEFILQQSEGKDHSSVVKIGKQNKL